MTSGFTKLFGSIVTSSVWCEDDQTFRVWIALLALADSDGVVEASVPGLAHLCRKTVEETERALERFMAPDPYSRSKENEGRRIVAIPGGWHLLNYEAYRERGQSKDGSRAPYMRQYRAAQRAKAAGQEEDDVTGDECNGGDVTRNTEEEAEEETDTTDLSGSAPADRPPRPIEPALITSPPSNPLVNRKKLEAEGYRLIRLIAPVTGEDPTAVLARCSTGNGSWRGRSKVNLATMTDDRLALTVEDLRAEWRRVRPHPAETDELSEARQVLMPPEPEPEAEDAWEHVLPEVARRIGKHAFATWFRPLQPLRFAAGVLQVHAPNELFADWLRENYAPAVALAVAAAGLELRVEFGVFERPPPQLE